MLCRTNKSPLQCLGLGCDNTTVRSFLAPLATGSTNATVAKWLHNAIQEGSLPFGCSDPTASNPVCRKLEEISSRPLSLTPNIAPSWPCMTLCLTQVSYVKNGFHENPSAFQTSTQATLHMILTYTLLSSTKLQK